MAETEHKLVSTAGGSAVAAQSAHVSATGGFNPWELVFILLLPHFPVCSLVNQIATFSDDNVLLLWKLLFAQWHLYDAIFPSE